MSRPRVYVTRKVPGEGLDLLKEKCTVSMWDSDEPVPKEELLNQVKGVHAIFCTISDRIDAAVLNAAGSNLKIVATMSVGRDHISVQECESRDIYVANTPDVASDSAADLTVALLLMTTRRLVEGLEAVRAGEWGPWKPAWICGMELMNKTVGIFGFGRVGFGVARRLRPFGVSDILYNDPYEAGHAKGLAKYVSFDELLSKSDVLCICCAVTPQTIGMFNKKTFQKMKKTSFLINTARGAIVNHDDLYDALKNGDIGAAGLDVTTPEPLRSDHPLIKLNNCIILPHMGTNTVEARHSMSVNTAKNIIAMLGLD
ncbi:hypothetical protein ScPMuIL_008344 [Solemya velum]